MCFWESMVFEPSMVKLLSMARVLYTKRYMFTLYKEIHVSVIAVIYLVVELAQSVKRPLQW